ncbi:MAG: methyltransferase domain-containing protein [Rhodobacteraceae bacterium]|nr:methyltransferase domain-containing protein [Paracoccaceae bacterium]PHR62287.1 MAG: hypothetical protein COA47_04760 [Robiginitomaculum sp.]
MEEPEIGQNCDGAVQKRLVKAIQNQSLHNTAAKLLAHPLGAAGLLACATISAHMLRIQFDVVDRLRKAGFKAEPVRGPADDSALQYHQIGVSIPRETLGETLALVAAMGFEASIKMTPARVKVFASTATQITLIRFDAVTARLVLRLDGPVRARLPARFRPGLVDLNVFDLPAALAPLYGLVKPFRVGWEKLSGRRSPNHEIDFLGTPDGLIAPILKAVELGPADVLIDLGCGDGRVVICAAEAFGCRAIGVEHNADLAARAQKAAAASPRAAQIKIIHGDAQTADISEATIVFMFLPRNLLSLHLPKARARLRPAARLVAHEQAALPGLPRPKETIPVMQPEGITVIRIWDGV